MFLHQQHEFLLSGPPADPRVYRASTLSSGAAVVLVVWDTLLTLDHEVDYIWSLSGRAHVKWIYFFSRWFGLLNQISSPIWLYFLAARAPVPTLTCEGFFVFEAVTFQFLQLCLNAILILRIWAVYQRRRPYVVAAITVVAFETLMSILTQTISVPKSTVDGNCLILHAPATILCLGVGLITSQSLLLFLTYRGNTFSMAAARRSKLVAVLVRDGMLVFGVATSIVLTSILYLIFCQAFINISWPWLPVVPSILTPRMILNMQRAAGPAESIPEFTTDFGTMPRNETVLPTRITAGRVHEVTMINDQSGNSS